MILYDVLHGLVTYSPWTALPTIAFIGWLFDAGPGKVLTRWELRRQAKKETERMRRRHAERVRKAALRERIKEEWDREHPSRP